MSTTTAAAAENTTGLRPLSDYTSTKSSGSSLDKDAFMQSLVAQLSNQDPLEPTDNTEYVAQLAQFTLLEQIQQLNSTTNTNQAYSLMGKYVYVDEKGDGSSYVFGQVDGVSIEDGKPYVMVGDQKYSYDSVVSVINSTDTTLEQELIQSADLIGKSVTAQITDDKGNAKTVSGEVTYIIAKNNAVYAVVDGTEVPIDSIQQIQA